MPRRVGYLLQYYVSLLLLFLLEKPLFMLYNGGLEGCWSVMAHGLVLDLATAAYLSIVPFLVVVVSLFFERFALRRVLLWYHALVALLLSLIFCADCALYPFWGYKLDASIFFYLQSPKEAMASVSVGYLALGVVVVAAMAWGIGWMLTHTTPRCWEGRPRRWSALLLLPVACLIFVAMRGGLGKSTANVGKAYFSDNQHLNYSAINPAFSLFYSLGKQEDFSAQFQYLPPEEVSSVVEPLFAETHSCRSLLREGIKPNVLLIVLEGFGHALLEAPDVAPNLQQLCQEGVFFSQCYAGSFRTDRGTVCLVSGHPGLPTTSLMKMPSKCRTLPSLPRELARQGGYSTTFVYGGDITFTNTKGYLLDMGYQRIVSDQDFSPSQRSSSSWGCHDEIVFEALYQDIMQRRDAPWHTALLTLSSHEPFEVPYQRLPDAVPNAFAYTDSCLGHFIHRLRQTPAWDNLLIVCIADHGFYYPREGFNHAPRVHHIPMLWLGGAIKEPCRIESVMNQYDLAATLLGQLGMDYSMFPFSRNALRQVSPWAFYTWSNGMAFIDTTGATLYDLDGNRTIEGDDPHRLLKAKALLQSLYADLGQR